MYKKWKYIVFEHKIAYFVEKSGLPDFSPDFFLFIPGNPGHTWANSQNQDDELKNIIFRESNRTKWNYSKAE